MLPPLFFMQKKKKNQFIKKKIKLKQTQTSLSKI